MWQRISKRQASINQPARRKFHQPRLTPTTPLPPPLISSVPTKTNYHLVCVDFRFSLKSVENNYVHIFPVDYVF